MKLYDDKLLVITGGAGFIGSGVLRCLSDKGMKKNLVVVDELGRSEKWKNLVAKDFGEFLSKEELFPWLEGRESEIAAFIHLGACSDTTERDADYLLQNNYRFSVNLAEYALKHGHRFIYASSAATYGNGSEGFSDDHDKLDVLRPMNMYGFSKHMFDMWAKHQGVLNSVVGLKYFNVFGPNENHKGHMASAITRMLPDLKEKGFINLFKSSDPANYADGEQCRDFIYVKDAVRMTCAFLESEVCGVFNIGTGNPSTWNQLAQSTIKAFGKEEAFIRYVDMPEKLLGKYQNYTCADMGKFREKMGDAAAKTMTIENSVIEYVREYLMKGIKW